MPKDNEKQIKDMTDDELESWGNIYYRQTGKDSKFIYEVEDKVFGTFKVLNTANGWWLDRGKVDRLIAAYKFDATNEEACSYTGITIDQLKYFNKLHKDFSAIKAACREVPNLRARKTVVEGIEDDKNFAMRYLEKKKPKEFGNRLDVTSGNKPLQRTEEERMEAAKRTAEWMKEWAQQLNNSSPTPPTSSSPTENKAKDSDQNREEEG